MSGRETFVYMYLCPLCFWICVDSTVNAFGVLVGCLVSMVLLDIACVW